VLLEPHGEGAPLEEDIARSQIAANRIVDDGIFAAGATRSAQIRKPNCKLFGDL
jgi:hypothetical protein